MNEATAPEPMPHERYLVNIDIELNKLNALVYVLECRAGLSTEQALKVAQVLEQLT